MTHLSPTKVLREDEWFVGVKFLYGSLVVSDVSTASILDDEPRDPEPDSDN